eukprot:385060_1
MCTFELTSVQQRKRSPEAITCQYRSRGISGNPRLIANPFHSKHRKLKKIQIVTTKDFSRRRAESSDDERDDAGAFQPEIIRASERESAREAETVDVAELTVPDAAPVEQKDNEASSDRRSKMRARILARQKMREHEERIKELQLEVESGEESGEASESEDSESESDSEYENPKFNLQKPDFIPKRERKTIAEREKAEKAEQEELEKMQTKRVEERRQESVKMVIESVREEEKIDRLGAPVDELEMPDDEDDDDEEVQFEHWKLRELRRMKRDADERTQREEQEDETARRRAMTDIERDADNRKGGHGAQRKDKSKMKFLQKYYHQGAFFQDDKLPDRLLRRDAMAAVGDDKYTDRLQLPQVLQVKNFGMASRTKYTHLMDQDTTGITSDRADRPYEDFGQADHSSTRTWNEADRKRKRLDMNPWNDVQSTISSRFKQGGAGDISRPSKRKKT